MAAGSVKWPLAGLAALLSLATMPITAIWFLVLAPLVLVAGAVAAALARSQRRRVEGLRIGASVGMGLLAGPLVYLALASAT